MIGSINEKNEVDGAGSKYGEKKGAYRIWWKKVSEREHLEDQYIDGRKILSWIFRKWDEGEDWIDLAQDRGRRWTIINMIINFPVVKKGGNFLTS